MRFPLFKKVELFWRIGKKELLLTQVELDRIKYYVSKCGPGIDSIRFLVKHPIFFDLDELPPKPLVDKMESLFNGYFTVTNNKN